MDGDGHILIPLRDRHGATKAHAIVDAQDAALAEHRWYLTHIDADGRGGYVARTVRNPRRVVYLHRAVLGVVGRAEVDHINGNRLDCRRANLRTASRRENAQNVPARGGTSPHRGVYLNKKTGRWIAVVWSGGECNWLGAFVTEDDAAAAASDWRTAHLPFTNENRAVAA